MNSIASQTSPVIASSYPLSPLQQGMLYHALAAPQSGVDIEQMVCTLREKVNTAKLREAWQKVVARHAVLRTAFRWEESPVQDVWAGAEVEFAVHHWKVRPAREQEAALEKWLRADRRRGFAMDAAPLMRLAVFVFGDADFRLVWTFHHALLDGRSFPLVLREVFSFYDSAEPPELSAARPFREYIDWLQTQQPSSSEAYWRKMLAGFRAPTSLVVGRLPGCAAESSRADADLRVSAGVTAALNALAVAHECTLNTLVQGAWALLLSRYGRAEEVVFGATRACRRSTIPGAEEMVGLFINTLPVRVRVEPDAPLMPWLRALRAQWLAMRPHEHTPLPAVQAWSDVPGGNALFDSIVVFENHELNDVLRASGVARRGREFRLYEQTNFPLTLAAYAGSELLLRLEFDRQRFDPATIERMLGHLRTLLEGFAATPAARLGDFALTTAAERAALLAAAVPAPPPNAPPETTLQALFSAQAARTPNAIAALCEGRSLTYRELDVRAAELALRLRELGAGRDQLVGLFMERGLDLIVGLLAILKTGAGYLPIDPGTPPERAAFMLADGQTPALLTQHSLAGKLPAHPAHVLCIEDFAAAGALPDEPGHPDDLAYAIFTSGSTGQPKGVAVTHRNVVRLFSSTQHWFHFDERDVWTMFHSVAFDFTVWEIWGALLHGGRLVVVPHAVSRSPDAFHALLVRERVTVLNQTPSAFRQLIAADQEFATSPAELALRLVIFGGEALEMRSLQTWFERHGDRHPQLVNMYGITETTVHVTYRALRADDAARGSVIGEPLPDLELHILDEALRPVPIGVPGELHVGGAGLSRGYLRRPELTAERFIPHTFSSARAARLYRTGDLARRLPDGDIEYLGRIDQQVQLRGFRVELGEIEAALAAHASVREACVIAREEAGAATCLIAYLVAQNAAPDVSTLRDHLRRSLPDYMVPAAFVFIDAMPLTANGKLDRRALPEPEPARPEMASVFVAPQTTAEQTLAAIWRKVLRLERVGIHDNFFELGGDSILSILIVSQARRAGLPLSPKHLFDNQTIAALARAVPVTTAPAVEEMVTGAVPLTPIQRWFFAHEFAEISHWNQSFIFEATEALDPTTLARAIDCVTQHHPAFRLRFTKDDGAWRQTHAEHAKPPSAASALGDPQAALDVAAGPLFCAVLLDPQRVLIAAHHLCIDGVSWRILLEDLETAYRMLAADQPVQLPPATNSFQRWAQLLTAAAQSPVLTGEFPHWLSLAAVEPKSLPRERTGENTEASAHTICARLSSAETEVLLQRLPALTRTRINDALLTALAQTLSAWTGETSHLIDLEGHGREEAAVASLLGATESPADLSRTIGWFTSLFPVRLDLPRDRSLFAIREQLNCIPRRGLGYGLLRELAGHDELRSKAEILFNYLGQFEQTLSGSELFRLSSQATGAWHSPRARRTHPLEINCLVVGGRLEARWTFSTNIHDADTIQRLADHFTAALRTLLTDHTLSSPEEDSYALSPMQRLFYTLETAQPNAGFDQWHFALRGALDVERFHEAWRGVLRRHTILRTAFCAEGNEAAPHQNVLRNVDLPLHVEDWRGCGSATQQERLDDFLRADRARGFDLAAPPLTRLALLRLRDDEWRFVWSHHHLQIDGWSWPLVFREVAALYGEGERPHEPHFYESADTSEDARARGDARPPALLAPARPYGDFIAWQQRRLTDGDEHFWRENLRGFQTPTPLPGKTATSPCTVSTKARPLCPLQPPPRSRISRAAIASRPTWSSRPHGRCFLAGRVAGATSFSVRVSQGGPLSCREWKTWSAIS